MTIKDIKALIIKRSTFLAPSTSGRAGLGIFILFVSQLSFAQDKKENIGTEEVNVVKPYSPTISDAFKVNEVPLITTEETTKKEVVNYSIQSFPVASTFKPSKGVAQGVERAKEIRLFKNYASLGIGNYGNLNAELYINDDLNNNEYVGGMFRHFSSQGGIKEVLLEDSFYNTKLDLFYGTHEQEMSWKVNLGFQNQIYNWYGLPENFGSTLTPTESNNLINGINPQQSYNTISATANISFFESFMKEGNLEITHFTDAFNSVENRLMVAPTFTVDIMDEAIKTKVVIDYLDGSFKKNYWETNTADIKYGFINLGIVPSFVMKRDDWTIDIGAGLFYSMGKENKSNKFYVYPSVTASYKVVGDLMIFYAGAVGNLEQNNYKSFVDTNPYVSPTLAIKPTNELYNVQAGLKGKLASTVSYDVKASYSYNEDKALFKSNDYTEKNINANYAFGNSFQVIYDDMKIMRLYGSIKADLLKGVTAEADATFSSYSNKFQEEAWNLPAIEFNAKFNFVITEKWFAGINLFYVGDRKDVQENKDIVYIIDPGPIKPITLDGYLDLNANIRFKYSDRFTTFLKANNILNTSYNRWLNYPVQGFQVLLGGNYKFDF